jgi:protein NrfC
MMAENDKIDETGVPVEPGQGKLSRRQFVTGAGILGFGAMLGGTFVKGILLPDETLAIPASKGYLIVDTKMCSGCDTCMLACATVHHGEASLSLSRIQVQTEPFVAFPEGIVQNQCRQCPFPACVEACPTGANHVDTEHGNVRTVDARKCIGCERCVAACPFTPARILWNNEEKHSQKCDLCTNTPFWNETGGIGGKQACVEFCPMHAIAFSEQIPAQTGVGGYQVNLRKDSPVWEKLGFPTSDSGDFTPEEAAAKTGH